MEEIDGRWIMKGVDYNDPDCLHSVDEAIAYIEKVGFLPLFANEIPGFSLEEHTQANGWWSDDERIDPWAWREIIARRRDIAYGKFFEKRAGFISKKWLPVFANYRREGYDFDALYEDGKAAGKLLKIMNNFMEENSDNEIFSNELKNKAGFFKAGKKSGDSDGTLKGFEGAMTNLQMMIYLCNCDFKKRLNKKGQEYGWNVAIFTTPEHLWGYDCVTSKYKDLPTDSFNQIVAHVKKLYPDTDEKIIRKVLK